MKPTAQSEGTGQVLSERKGDPRGPGVFAGTRMVGVVAARCNPIIGHPHQVPYLFSGQPVYSWPALARGELPPGLWARQEETTLADFIYYMYLKRTARTNVAIGMML